MKKIILLALILRIILAPLAEHGDVIQYFYWSKDIYDQGLLGFYDRNIANAMRPTYPPVTSYIFYLNAIVHIAVLKIFWFLNNIPIFPSGLIHWLESEKGWFFINKIPPIISDLGIIFLLFQFAKKFDKKTAHIPPVLFAFLPPFFYSSSVWGQTDSIYGLFLLCSLFALSSNLLLTSSIFYTISLLTKPTAFFAMLPFGIYWLMKSNILKTLLAFLLTALLLLAIYYPFHPQNQIPWMIRFISHSLGGELNYLVANAFNFWALFFGFDNRPDTTLFLGIPIFILGNFIFLLVSLVCIITILIQRKKIDIKNILLLCSFSAFTAFMFLPRMHERYFYPALLLLLPLTGLDKKIRYLTIVLSIIHFLNLYHFFWVPKVDFLILFFSNFFVEKILIIINIICYLYLAKEIYQRFKRFRLPG